MRRGTLGLLLALAAAGTGWTARRAEAAPSAEVLRVYGPGGPLPAMREAAARFEALEGVKVQVEGGPTKKWLSRARRDADVVYSGSEHMMTELVEKLGGRIDEASVTPLYLRASALLVRPGNPRRITRFEDLLAPGVQVMVVQGAGQAGLWEDVAGRKGSIETVRALRRNIALFAPTTGEALRAWKERPELDAWIVWTIWAKANPGLAEVVPVEEAYAIYRDCGVALTRQGSRRESARRFVAFLQSPEGARIFERWGWMAGGPAAAGPPRPVE